MSRRTDVLNRWVADTLRAVPPAEIRKEAERLAAEFTAFAADAGMNLERLEEDLGDNLVNYMVDALEAVAAADAGRLSRDDG